jgi:hypothetical protein
MPAVLKSDLSVEVESPEIARRCVCRTHKMSMCLSNSHDDDSMPMCLSNSQDVDVSVELTR